MRIIKILASLALTGALVCAGGFAALMIACGGGGMMVYVIPATIVILPIYYQTMKFLLRRQPSSSAEGVDAFRKLGQQQSSFAPQIEHSALVSYIENARAYGATDEVIRVNLSDEGGWLDEEVQEAFSIAQRRRGMV